MPSDLDEIISRCGLTRKRSCLAEMGSGAAPLQRSDWCRQQRVFAGLRVCLIRARMRRIPVWHTRASVDAVRAVQPDRAPERDRPRYCRAGSKKTGRLAGGAGAGVPLVGQAAF